MSIDVDDRSVREAVAEVFGSVYEPTTEECEWCARNVPITETARFSVRDEPCPETSLRLCHDCHPAWEVRR